jgi:hypothetical protein
MTVRLTDTAITKNAREVAETKKRRDNDSDEIAAGLGRLLDRVLA